MRNITPITIKIRLLKRGNYIMIVVTFCVACACAKLCPILCDSMDCSPPVSFVHRISQGFLGFTRVGCHLLL